MVYVYLIDCPAHDGGIMDGGDVYVGQTIDIRHRLSRHTYNKNGCPKLSNWLKKRRREKLPIRVVELACVETRPEAARLEIAVIKALRPISKLLNLTDGGDGGASGTKRSKEAIAKARSKQLGEKHPNAKLTSRKVELIKLMRGSGARQRIVAKIFGVSQSLISDICKGKRWREDEPVDVP